jgi:uncharacterized protein with NRDE domain
MCVLALALNQHPDWPIILIGNRDEFHDRAAAPLHAWDDASGIIAGRDLVGGGTWLGAHPAGARLVVVTNVRSDRRPDPDKLSRGLLVRDLLTGRGEHAAPDTAQLDAFNGFSMIALDGAGARLLTNRPAPTIRALPPGVHALANAAAGGSCPRADRLAAAVDEWLAADAPPAALLRILTDTADPALFLRNPVYGTRCSTVVAIGTDGAGIITERRYDRSGDPIGETALGLSFSA